MSELLIADEIARGGMGTVRLAFRRTEDFGRALALKRPSGGGPGDSVEQELLREARLNAMLRHPNIVEVLDVGVDERGLFLVMDYVEGVTLRELPRLPAQLAWHVIVQVALALHAAHTHMGDDGVPAPVVHRDVSPSNVMVGFDGSVRLMDFGLARSARDPLTQRYLRGTPGYMAPEALRFDPLTPAADVFQLAVVAHELLDGERLYGDDDLRIVARRILDEAPPACSEGSEESRELLQAALAKDPAERPAALTLARYAEGERRSRVRQEGALALADWLQSALAPTIDAKRRWLAEQWMSHGVPAPSTRPPPPPALERRPERSSRRAVASAALAALLGAGAVGLWLGASDQAAPERSGSDPSASDPSAVEPIQEDAAPVPQPSPQAAEPVPSLPADAGPPTTAPDPDVAPQAPPAPRPTPRRRRQRAPTMERPAPMPWK